MSDEPDLRDLPSLERWGDHLRDATEREEQRKTRRGFPVRRFAVAVAVMLAAVPGAVATRSIWLDPIDRVDPTRDPSSTPPVRLAQGRSGDVDWLVGAYTRPQSASRCVEIQAVTAHADFGGTCSRPTAGPAQIIAATGIHDGVGFVFGTVAADVSNVVVTVAGGRTVRVPAQAPDPEALRRGSLPALRVFVAAFREGFDPVHPPTIVARGHDGHILGSIGAALP